MLNTFLDIFSEKYWIATKGDVIYGVGRRPTEALLDAGFDSDEDALLFPCTEELYDAVLTYGGDVNYEVGTDVVARWADKERYCA